MTVKGGKLSHHFQRDLFCLILEAAKSQFFKIMLLSPTKEYENRGKEGKFKWRHFFWAKTMSEKRLPERESIKNIKIWIFQSFKTERTSFMMSHISCHYFYYRSKLWIINHNYRSKGIDFFFSVHVVIQSR